MGDKKTRSEIIEKRLRKSVNYAKLNGNIDDDVDDDDDFQIILPPTKLKKVVKKESTKSNNSNDSKNSNKRTAVSDRIFERNIKEALTKSKMPRLDADDDEDDEEDDFFLKDRSKKFSKDFKKANDSPEIAKNTKIEIRSPKIPTQSPKASQDDAKLIITPNVSVICIETSQPMSQINGTPSPTLVGIKTPPSSREEAIDEIILKNIEIVCNKDDIVESLHAKGSSDDEYFLPGSHEITTNSLPHCEKSAKENRKESTPIKPRTKNGVTSKPVTKQMIKPFTNPISKEMTKPVTKEMLTIKPVIKETTKPVTRGLKNLPIDSKSDLLCHVKPVNIPAVGLRVGLSRNRSVKPLHPNIKPV